jgi:PAS domain S-box-containing protein
MCVLWGPDHLCVHNDAFLTTLGAQGEQLTGRPGHEVLADIWDELGSHVDFVLHGEGGTWLEERKITLEHVGHGTELTINYGCHPLYEPTAPNEVGGVLVVLHDVTERVRARELNRELEEARTRALHAFEAILDHSLDIILTLDSDLRITQVSKSGEAAFGLSRDALLGRPFAEIVAPDERDVLLGELASIMRGEPLAGFETRVLRTEGSAVPVQWTATWVEVEQKIFAVGRDLTERQDVERRLRSAQRMEAIGRLSGRIAHDFNNILAVVLGNSELLVEILAQDEVARPLAELVTQAAERGATLVSRLLAYSQRQHLERHRLEPGPFLETLAQRIARDFPANVVLDLQCDPAAWPSLVDIGQLETSIEDLVSNAVDAMPDGGRIAIHCDNFVVVPEATLREALGLVGSRHEVNPGDYLRIVVEDEGVGMTPEVLGSAFEPFFTTKDVNKGTGLGLSMVLGFIRQSEGHVGVVSRVGRGTRVTLLLPRLVELTTSAPSQAEATKPAAAPESGAASAAGGNGKARRILVVEDEAAMRKHVVAQLARAGYEVVGAADAKEALAHLEAGERFDLLFTDLLMPGGMNGRQLADVARQKDPGLRVLYTSGYTAESLAGRTGSEIEADLLLTKPYRKTDLLERVSNALSSR